MFRTIVAMLVLYVNCDHVLIRVCTQSFNGQSTSPLSFELVLTIDVSYCTVNEIDVGSKLGIIIIMLIIINYGCGLLRYMQWGSCVASYSESVDTI